MKGEVPRKRGGAFEVPRGGMYFTSPKELISGRISKFLISGGGEWLRAPQYT